MMGQLRNGKLTSLFWGFMALYMLNICVDSPDASPYHVPQDLSYNDQESIVEIILEKVLGCEDAIPEYDDNDPDQNTILKNNISIYNFILPFFESKFNGDFSEGKRQNNSIYFSYIPIHYLEIHSPPPEA